MNHILEVEISSTYLWCLKVVEREHYSHGI